MVPVVAKIVETPAGVILVTLLAPLFAVYIFPEESTTIPWGWVAVVPSVIEVAACALGKMATKNALATIAIVKIRKNRE